MTLSTAPLHILVKWTDRATGSTWNLEATSGGGVKRDASYSKELDITEKALSNGVYLKTLNRREALALMTSSILQHLLVTGRYEDAVQVADVLIGVNPADAYAIVKKGTAYYYMLQRDIVAKYPNEADIPADMLDYAHHLLLENKRAFDQAEALGWRMPELQ
jgi:hypothetical protein